MLAKTKKLFSIHPLVFLSGFYLVTRLYHLTILPIFNDESWIIYWGKFIAVNNSHWFFSLTDGKPPLFYWLMAFFFKLFPSLPYLFVGRLPSVLTGFISLIGIYKVSDILFRTKRISIFAAFFYIISPFALMYDRQGLIDSLLSAMILWSMYFTIKTSISFRYRDAILWGLFLGLALFSKTSASLFLAISPLAFFIFSFQNEKQVSWKKKLLFAVIAIIIGEGIQSSLMFSHGYHDYLKANQHYLPNPLYLLTHPLLLFIPQTQLIMSWLVGYQGLLFCIGVVLGNFILLKYLPKQGLVLLLWWIVPIMLFAFVGSILFPRYLLFALPPMIMIFSYFLSLPWRKNSYLKILLTILILFFQLYFDQKILFDPPAAALPAIEKEQFITSWPSGYGLQKVYSFIHNESKKHPVTLVAVGAISSYPYAFDLEFWGDKNVTIVSIWPVTKETENAIQTFAKKQPTYVVLKLTHFEKHADFVSELHLQKLFTADKPGGDYPTIVALPLSQSQTTQ